MPAYGNTTPAAGSAVAVADSLVFDVTDAADGLASVFVYVSYADGTTEVVYTGDGFGPRFATSTRESITDGYAFTINRVGGWDKAPLLRSLAVSTTGSTENLATDYVLAATETAEPRPVIGAPAVLALAARQPVNATVLGRGPTMPFRRDGKGDIANGSDVELIRSNVYRVLSTICSSPRSRGELPWRPEFGSLLNLMRFRNNDGVLGQVAQEYVIDALRIWEPRARVKSANIVQDPEAATLTIVLLYDVVTSRQSIIQAGVRQAFTTAAA